MHIRRKCACSNTARKLPAMRNYILLILKQIIIKFFTPASIFSTVIVFIASLLPPLYSQFKHIFLTTYTIAQHIIKISQDSIGILYHNIQSHRFSFVISYYSISLHRIQNDFNLVLNAFISDSMAYKLHSIALKSHSISLKSHAIEQHKVVKDMNEMIVHI